MEPSTQQLRTDDLAFSAWLKMKGHPLITSHQHHNKSIFTFDIRSKDENKLKIEFLNSEFLSFYNELRNLKKII